MILMPPLVHPFPKDYVYDLECYPNFFSATFKNSSTSEWWAYEISEWKNQGKELHHFLMTLVHYQARLVGYNNLKYDYPMLHLIIEMNGLIDHITLYQKSQAIISDWGGRAHSIWENKHYLRQMDLMAIHHFDNKAKMTSLKILEFNMCSKNIIELPYDPNFSVTRAEADHLLSYSKHDVNETEMFYFYTFEQIKFREELHAVFGKSVINHNDGKIGAEFILKELHEQGIETKRGSQKIQTFREIIHLKDVIFDYVSFDTPEFQAIHAFFLGQSIKPAEIKGFFTDKNPEVRAYLNNMETTYQVSVRKSSTGSKPLCVISNGFQFDFGSGGIHGSQHATIVRSNDTHILIDEDVASFYPNLGIKNKLFPEHLTVAFCPVYEGIYIKRKTYKKGTPTNNGLKLGLNTVYGNSNSEFSEFYDPQYTLAITINGQLLLCMLAEKLMKIPGLEMVQVNTDGLTYLCPREYQEYARSLSAWWEGLTGLQLEDVGYDAMYIRHVNSYMAKTMKGYTDREGNTTKSSYVKRIGDYANVRAMNNSGTRELVWNKNHGAVIVAMAAEAALVYDIPIETFIRSHRRLDDFMMRTKVPRASSLVLHQDGIDHKVQNVSRYYASTSGGELFKLMPPTQTQIDKWKDGDHYVHRKTGKYQIVARGKKAPSGMFDRVIPDQNSEHPVRRNAECKGQLVRVCNDMAEASMDDVDFTYYIEKAKEIVNPLLLGEKARETRT